MENEFISIVRQAIAIAQQSTSMREKNSHLQVQFAMGIHELPEDFHSFSACFVVVRDGSLDCGCPLLHVGVFAEVNEEVLSDHHVGVRSIQTDVCHGEGCGSCRKASWSQEVIEPSKCLFQLCLLPFHIWYSSLGGEGIGKLDKMIINSQIL